MAIDTLLFSRIGSPLCHRYRLISWTGSHTAFRGTYLRRLRAFLDESDSAVVRQFHRRLAEEFASHVVLSTDSPASVQPRSTIGHRTVAVSRSRRPRRLKGVTNSAGGRTGLVRFTRRGRWRLIRRRYRLQLSWIQAGKGTHAVRWTRRRCRQCTSTWMRFRHHQRRSCGMRRNVVICR